MTVTARSLAPRPSGWHRTAQVVEVRHAVGRASVVVEANGVEAGVHFEDVVALRVMDERDLMAFWPTCSTPNGWLFEVTNGGWLSQERLRDDSCIRFHDERLREFLVAGIEDCVSVLATLPPRVTSPVNSDVAT